MKSVQSQKKRFSVVLILVLLIVLSSCSAKKYQSKKNITVAFYNVENLFDLKNEPGKRDGEFTPAGSKKWDEKRYQKKLHDLARVLSSINKNELPEIIGLAEVENKHVVEDLANTGDLKTGNYEVIHFESPDFRGIDCALMYRPDEFKPLFSAPVKVTFANDPDYVTRDILYVKGKIKGNENLHIFVNHWPSRIGGLDKTEPKRLQVAAILKSKIDSVLESNPGANIVVMGDMNDEPQNKSLFEVLGAKLPDSDAGLVNLMLPDDLKNLGTYNYRNNWNMLDNLVISKTLLDKKGFVCTAKKGFIFRQSWMEYTNSKGQVSPNRTYGGPNYYGGVSDHFPVYFMLKK